MAETKKQVLIAGAGSGIGAALFQKFASSSEFETFGISRRGQDFEKSAVLKPGFNYKCDLTQETDIENFVSAYSASYKSLDIIYLCHGSGAFFSLSDLDSTTWDTHFSLNVRSNFLIMKNFYPFLKQSESHPYVCFLSSTAGYQGFPDSSAYCASKHAVAGMARALREEWKPDRIRVLLIYPGAVSTSIWDSRPEFNRADMISADEFSEYLLNLAFIPGSINLDEIKVLPKKGIL